MAQVPYSPVPVISPSAPPLPRGRVEAPEAAFGGAAAAATGRVGQALEASGNELFSRAIALQQLDNEAQARQLEVDAGEKMGKARDDFITLSGVQAKNGLQGYQDNLKGIKQQAVEAAPNPMVRRYLDSQLTSRVVRDLDFAGQHAATEFKKYQAQTMDAEHKSWMDQVLSNPDDADLFQSVLTRSKIQAAKQAGLMGFGPDDEATRLLQKQRESEIYMSKIEGLARHDPDAAKKLQELALQRGVLLGQDYEKLVPKVDAMLHNIVSRNVSDAVNKGWAPYVTKAQASRSQGVEQSLIDVLQRAQQNHPELQFMIGHQGGARTQAEQDALYAQGRTTPGKVVTWTRSSEHLTGRAIDVAGLNSATTANKVTGAMREAADQLGVKLADTPFLAKNDPGHFQLAGDFAVKDYKSPELWTEEQRSKAAEDYVTGKYSDPKMTYATTDRVRTDARLQLTGQRKEQADTLSSLKNFIYDNNITNKDMILNTPTLNEAYNRLNADGKTRLDHLMTALSKAPTQETPEKRINAQRILNSSTELSGHRAEFLDLDAPDLMNKGVISMQGMTQIMAQQRKILAGQANDSRHLQHAMSLGKDYMKANNIVSGSDDEVQLTGRMNQYLEDYVSTHKSFPPDKEIRDKWADLVSSSGGFLGIGATYNYETPQEFIDKITPLYQKRYNGALPTKEQLARMYERAKANPQWLKGLLGE